MFLTLLCSSLLAAVCLVCSLWYLRRNVYYKSLKEFPGTPPTFIIGNISWIIGLYSKAKKMEHPPAVYILERIIGSAFLYRKFGMYAFWMGPAPFVTIYSAEIMEKIFSSNVSIEKSREYDFLHKWLGTGLLTSTGDKWRHRRKLLTPSFHFRILEDFFPVFNQQSEVLVQKLKSLTEKPYIDIAPLIVLCTLDIICETVMGVSIGAQAGENSEYVKAIHKSFERNGQWTEPMKHEKNSKLLNLAEFFNKRSVYPWLWKDFLFGLTKMGRSFNRDIDILHNFTDKVIREKKENLLAESSTSQSEEKNEDEYFTKRRRTFMDLLLNMHVKEHQLSEADIREEVDTFMFEGHDTTAVGITFALYCIGLYPDIQKKIVEEMDEIFGGDIDRPITYDDTRNMKYLECVLKESQRLYPSVPIIGRKTAEPVHYGGLTIPENTTIHCNLMSLHRDPKFFPNPEVFDPERFLPENSLTRHPYSYVPFSAGARNCIGQKFAMLEEKTVVCNVLRHFNIMSLDPRDKMHAKVEFTLRPAHEVRLKFVPRR